MGWVKVGFGGCCCLNRTDWVSKILELFGGGILGRGHVRRGRRGVMSDVF